MRMATGIGKNFGERIVKDFKRATCKHVSPEEKIRIVLNGLRGEDSIAEPCRRGGISWGVYSKLSGRVIEAGKLPRAGGTWVSSVQARDFEQKSQKTKSASLALSLGLMAQHGLVLDRLAALGINITQPVGSACLR